MKKGTLLLFFFTITIFSFSQNTWVHRISNGGAWPYQHADNLTGIKCIEVGADGDIYAIGNYGSDNNQTLIKISSNGTVGWGVGVGYHGGLTGGFANNVRATSDSGCIVASNFWGQSGMFHIDGFIQKYTKDGTIEWSQTFGGFFSGGGAQSENEAFDAIEIGNNYYALVGDSVVKFDHSGNIISYDSTCKFPLQQFADGDFLFSKGGNLSREDSLGNVIWSGTVTGSCGCPSTYYYIYNNTSVYKLDLADGSTIWNKSYPFQITSVDSTDDGGFVASFGYIPGKINSWAPGTTPGIILRADSAGDTLWTHTYTFPEYGLPKIKVHPSGKLLTGGAFRLTDRMVRNYNRDYSSFIATLDSNGHGILETESYIWPGDANNNLYFDFVDEAPDIGIAWGATGVPRDDSSDTYWLMPGIGSDFAADWPDTFSTGVNYKHADFNGDGIIDMDDLIPYASVNWFFIPNWRNSQQETLSTSAELRLVTDQDTVNAGDTIVYSLILGSANAPVDSLYAFAFATNYPSAYLDSAVQAMYVTSDFGIPGADQITYDFKADFGFDIGLSMMMSKTNHQNVYQLHDTLALIYMKSNPATLINQVFGFTFTGSKAVTLSGSLIGLNTSSDHVVIRPLNLRADNNDNEVTRFYPNPVSDLLTVNLTDLIYNSVEVINSLGETVETFNATGLIKLNVSDYPAGFYSMKIISDETVTNFSFLVVH
jgi:hypothetical protein